MLIQAGANVKIKGYLTTPESGYTALHYAARNNYWEMLDILVDAGADVDAMVCVNVFFMYLHLFFFLSY